jgi:hypothetical protein
VLLLENFALTAALTCLNIFRGSYEARKLVPIPLLFHLGEDINVEYPPPALQKDRNPNREANAIDFQSALLCSTSLDSRLASRLNGDIAQPFSYNPTPPLPVEHY